MLISPCHRSRFLELYQEQPKLSLGARRVLRGRIPFSPWLSAGASREKEKGASNTRLILRARANYGPRFFRALTLPFILAGGEALTARKMLYGIKSQVESTEQGTGGRLNSDAEG